MAYNYSEEGSAYALVPLDKAATLAVRNIEPAMPVEMIDQMFHMQINPKTGKFKLVIDKAGLNWKMDQLYRGKYDLKTDVLMGEEYDFIKTNCLGFKKEDRVIICKSELRIEVANGKEKVFTAYGTATPDNVKKGQKHPLELAETRAEKRVLQKATGCGFSAADCDEFLPTTPEIDTKELIEAQRKRMWVLLKDAGYKEEDRSGRISFVSNCLGRKIESTKGMTYADYLKVNNTLETIKKGEIPPPPECKGDIIDGDYTITEEPPLPPPSPGITPDQLNQINNLYIEAKWDTEKQEKYFAYMREKNPDRFTTLKTAADFSQEDAEKFISLLKKKVIEADRKAMEIPPPTPAPEEAPIIAPQERHAHVPASYSQIAEADELFKQLEYDWQKKGRFFEKYRYETGETYVKSVKDMDFIKAGLLIDHLKKELAEKHKMENGQFPGGVTEEENEAEKQDIRDNTIPTSEKMQDMFDGDVPF
ncbi:MAG TPA: hypothetical protein PKJ95_00155 [Atribacterota bacterium]|nr:hypothetical protein [Atribacterota bacterium]